MRDTRRFTAWISALCALLIASAAWAQSLAERVPADALIYAEWAGGQQLKGAYDQSHLKAVVDQTSWPEFLDTGVPRLIGRLPDMNVRQRQLLRDVYTVFGQMAQHPTALYLAPIAPPENGPPQFRIMLLSNAGADADALREHISGVLTGLQAEGGEFPFPVNLRVEGQTVVLDIGTAASATTQPAPDKPLANDPLFKTAMANLQSNAAIRVYLNIPGVLDNVERAALSGPPDAQNNVEQVISALQLRGLGPIAMSAGFDGKDWLQQVFVGKGEKDLPPILKQLLGTEPLSADALARVPADATIAAAGRLDFAALWNEVVAAAEQFPNAQPERIESGIDNLNKMAGFNIHDDFLAALGPQYAFYMSPSVGGGPGGLVMVNTPRNIETLKTSLQHVEGMAAAILSRQARRGQPNFAPQVVKFGDTAVHYVALFVVAPSWTFSDSQMTAALSPQAAAAASRLNGPSLTTSPAYQQVMQRLGVKDPTSVAFLDLPRTAPGSYGLLTQLATIANTFGHDLAPMSLVPPLPALEPELTPGGGAGWNDDAGWHYKVILPLPGAQILAGGMMR